MKKLLSLTLALALTFVLASCSDKKEETNTDVKNDGTVVEENITETVYENVDLYALADSLYASFGADELPMLGTIELGAEDFESHAFIPYNEEYKAVLNQPMIGSIAHAVVIVETPDAETAKTVAQEMKENANPRKWICVEAEKVESATNGNLAILVMSDSKTDAIVEAFKAVNAETMPVMGDEAATEDTADDELAEDEAADVEENTEEEPTEEVPAYSPEDDEKEETKVEEPKKEETKKEETKVEEPKKEEPKTEEPKVETPEVTEPEVDVPAVEEPEVEEPEVKEEPETEENVQTGSIDTLYAIADKLYNGIAAEDMPMVGTMELTEENFEYSAFVPYKSSYLAVESLPMIGAMPHSVVIVKAASAAEAAELASSMKANANPRKWICVNAKSVKSASKGEYAILVMTSVEVMPEDYDDEAAIEAAEKESAEKSEERASLIINNFLAAV